MCYLIHGSVRFIVRTERKSFLQTKTNTKIFRLPVCIQEEQAYGTTMLALQSPPAHGGEGRGKKTRGKRRGEKEDCSLCQPKTFPFRTLGPYKTFPFRTPAHKWQFYARISNECITPRPWIQRYKQFSVKQKPHSQTDRQRVSQLTNQMASRQASPPDSRTTYWPARKLAGKSARQLLKSHVRTLENKKY